jgi:hypothetical protein
MMVGQSSQGQRRRGVTLLLVVIRQVEGNHLSESVYELVLNSSVLEVAVVRVMKIPSSRCRICLEVKLSKSYLGLTVLV